MKRACIAVVAVALSACGENAEPPAQDGAAAMDAGTQDAAAADDGDGGNSANNGEGGQPSDGAESGYGDGTCTAQEFEEGNEAIQIVADLSSGGLALAQGYLAEHGTMLDGIWADCTEEFCPIVDRIYRECAGHYIDLDAGQPDPDEDTGPPPSNPCIAAPDECDVYLQ